MRKHRVLFLLLVPIAISQVAYPQGSAGRGKAAANPVSALSPSQQVFVVRTRAIQQYMAAGAQYEGKKQWDNARTAYEYVLKVVALRDGPGSVYGVPALQRLVAVSKAQSKFDQAIGYQDTVLNFAKAPKTPDSKAILNAQMLLADLLVQNKELNSAEVILGESITYCTDHPGVSPELRKAAYKAYVDVLRSEHKDGRADEIEKIAAQSDRTANAGEASPKPAASTGVTTKEVKQETAQAAAKKDLTPKPKTSAVAEDAARHQMDSTAKSDSTQNR
jgi:MalT-like TPR region